MRNELLSDKDRDEFLEKFLVMYNKGDLFKEGNKALLDLWTEVYLPRVPDHIKNRVRKIDGT